MRSPKKVATIVAIALIGFFIYTDPIGASTAAKNGLGKIGDAGDSAITFSTNLFNG